MKEYIKGEIYIIGSGRYAFGVFKDYDKKSDLPVFELRLIENGIITQDCWSPDGDCVWPKEYNKNSIEYKMLKLRIIK